jgi:hypothetical protein
MFKNHGLPINLLVLNERDRMAISFGFEQRGILLAQAEITQRRYRQQLALHRIHELEMEKQDVEMQQQIRQAERTLDVAVIEALQRVLIFFPPDPIARESDAPLDMPGKNIDIIQAYRLSLLFSHADDWVDRMMTMGRVI